MYFKNSWRTFNYKIIFAIIEIIGKVGALQYYNIILYFKNYNFTFYKYSYEVYKFIFSSNKYNLLNVIKFVCFFIVPLGKKISKI